MARAAPQCEIEQHIAQLAVGTRVAEGLAVADYAAGGVDLREGFVLVVGGIGETLVGDGAAVVDGVAAGVLVGRESERRERVDVRHGAFDAGLTASQHVLH